MKLTPTEVNRILTTLLHAAAGLPSGELKDQYTGLYQKLFDLAVVARRKNDGSLTVEVN